MDKKLRIEKIRQACVYKNKVIRIHKLIRIITLIATAFIAIAFASSNSNSHIDNSVFSFLGALMGITLFVVWKNESTTERNSFLVHRDIVRFVIDYLAVVVKEADALKIIGTGGYAFYVRKTGMDIDIKLDYNGYDINEKKALKEKVQQELAQVEKSVADVTNLKIDLFI